MWSRHATQRPFLEFVSGGGACSSQAARMHGKKPRPNHGQNGWNQISGWFTFTGTKHLEMVIWLYQGTGAWCRQTLAIFFCILPFLLRKKFVVGNRSRFKTGPWQPVIGAGHMVLCLCPDTFANSFYHSLCTGLWRSPSLPHTTFTCCTAMRQLLHSIIQRLSTCEDLRIE